jgi:hypothetical protein
MICAHVHENQGLLLAPTHGHFHGKTCQHQQHTIAAVSPPNVLSEKASL